MLKNKIKLTALCMALVGTTGANVAQAAESGVYLGLNAGQAEARKYCNNITNCDSADTSVRGEVGYQFNNNLGAELGYTSFGTLFNANDNNVNAKQDASAWTASALGTWPVAERFGIFGRLGLARYNVSNSGTVQGVPVADKNSTKPYFGAGVKFDLASNWMLRAEYQLYTDISGVDGTKDNVQGWYLGGVYRF
ncbi:MAG: outer membrane beta-barrel protein [Gammaproteobacteria bacterium]|jgi:OOP family OmpA-OmpF porin|nr:porin family protein [Gammaproteobacteria bacterium]